MQILHIISGLKTGGAELMLKRLIASHSKSEKYQHIVISLTEVDEIGEQLKSIGVSVYALGSKSMLGIPKILWQLFKHIQKNRPDVVQTWMYHADLLGGLAARLVGTTKIIWGIRTTDVTVSGSRSASIVRRLCTYFSYFVPHTIVCAANASRLSHIRLGYCANRMVVISNGFHIDQIQITDEDIKSFRNELGLLTPNLTIGCVGRFNTDKDQYNFIQAAEIVCNQQPDARFIMVGRGCDAKNAELIRWINTTGFSNRFILLGERNDVPLCLSVMDVFCLPSRTEGFPNVVGEAMAMRRPCVVTDVGDAALLIGNCGIVVPKENSTALAAGMLRLLNLPEAEQVALGAQAYQRIKSEFAMDRTQEKFEQLYESLIADQLDN